MPGVAGSRSARVLYLSAPGSVKVSLVYSPSAGDGVSVDEIRSALVRAGHELVETVTVEDEVAAHGSIDAVLAAGGDGTVAKVARALAGRGIPLAILPCGTANNIASSLGIEGSITRVIDRWRDRHRTALDIGVASWGGEDVSFVESVGGGLVSTGIVVMDREPPPAVDEDAEDRVARAIERYADILAKLAPHRAALVVDGEPIEGAFLLIEVLNIATVGPNFRLTGEVDPTDGFFDVVTAGEEHRDALARYLADRIAGRDGQLDLPRRRARQVEIHGWRQMHIDDDVRQGPAVRSLSLRIRPGAVDLLV